MIELRDGATKPRINKKDPDTRFAEVFSNGPMFPAPHQHYRSSCLLPGDFLHLAKGLEYTASRYDGRLHTIAVWIIRRKTIIHNDQDFNSGP